MNNKDRQSENDVKQFVQLPGCIPDKENIRQGLFFWLFVSLSKPNYKIVH